MKTRQTDTLAVRDLAIHVIECCDCRAVLRGAEIALLADWSEVEAIGVELAIGNVLHKLHGVQAVGRENDGPAVDGMAG
jgi:hypothetical protein